MKKYYTIIALLPLVCLGLTVGCSEDKNVAAELETLVMENLKATEAEDMNTMLETIHTQSPSYAQTEKLSAHLFENYDVKYELQQFQFVGIDGEYAIARYKFSTKRVAGGDFKDNTLDTFHVFRKENGKWKIWSQAALEIDYIN